MRWHPCKWDGSMRQVRCEIATPMLTFTPRLKPPSYHFILHAAINTLPQKIVPITSYITPFAMLLSYYDYFDASTQYLWSQGFHPDNNKKNAATKNTVPINTICTYYFVNISWKITNEFWERNWLHNTSKQEEWLKCSKKQPLGGINTNVTPLTVNASQQGIPNHNLKNNNDSNLYYMLS